MRSMPFLFLNRTLKKYIVIVADPWSYQPYNPSWAEDSLFRVDDDILTPDIDMPTTTKAFDTEDEAFDFIKGWWRNHLAETTGLPDFPGIEKANRGSIKKNDNNKFHGERLQRLGFNVIDDKSDWVIECVGFVNQCRVEDLPEMAANKLLIHFNTQVQFKDGKVLSGIEALKALKTWSCIMCNPEP